MTWNQDSANQPIILLHGLASNARIWELTAPFLADNDYRIVAPDARGHGLSDKPEGEYSFEVMSQDLAAFISTLCVEKPIIVGHSWGASVALEYAARYSRGVYSPYAVILVDGGIGQLNEEPDMTLEKIRLRLAPPKLAGTPLELFLKRLTTYNPKWSPDETALSIIMDNFDIQIDPDSGEETIHPRLTFDRHMQIVDAMWYFNTREKYSLIQCPVCIIPARPATPYTSTDLEYLNFKQRGIEQAHRYLKLSRVHWMDDTIHDIPLQKPRELAELIDEFITSELLQT